MFWLAVLILASSGLPKLKFNTDTRIFFGQEDPHLSRLLEFEETFQPTRKALYVISSDDPIDKSGTLRRALVWLSQEVAKLPEATRVDSLATVSHPYDSDGEVYVDPYLEYICPNECLSNRLAVLNEPLTLRRLVSKDLKTVSVMGVFDIERNATERLATIASAASDLKEKFRQRYPDLNIYLTGGIPVSQEFIAAGRRDMSTLFALSGVLIILLMWAILGDIRNTAIMLGTALSAVITCMGFGGWVGMELTSVASTIPIIVLTLVVASTMHLFTHFMRLSDTVPDPALAAATAINANYIPILLTTLTSAASLASLWFITSPPVRDLGLVAAVGLLVGGLLAITATPLFLETRKRTSSSFVNDKLQAWLNAYAKRLENGIPAPLTGFLLILSLSSGLLVLQLDDDFVAYLSDRTEVRRDSDFALRELAGPSHIEVELEAKGGVFNPEFLSELENLTQRLRTIPEVASATSLSDLMTRVATAFGETRPLSNLSNEALSQYFFVYELGLRSGDSASDIVSFDHSRTHIPLLLNSTRASDVRRINQIVTDWLKEYQHLSGVVTGENMPVAYLSTSNIPSLAKTVITSLAITSLLLAVVFRNWRFGVNSLIAITVPIICGLGAWGWISGSIGLSGTIVIAIALGVVIDDAIHLLYQQRQSLDRAESAVEATSYSVHRVGVPIVATTGLFLLGLSPLLFSNFQVNVTFAAVTCLVIAFSLAFDLGILPKLMEWAGTNDHLRTDHEDE